MNTTEWRVYGPPGTGKTTWMAERAGLSVEKFGRDMVSICSLTNAAVREAAGRDLTIDPDNMTTLHARCKRALGAPAPAESRVKEFAEAYPSRSGPDSLPPSVWRTASDVSDVVLSGGGLTHYESANILRQQLIPETEWSRDVREWYQFWKAFCRDIEHYDFTGWLEAALAAGALPPQQVVYVDEAQDHTPLQLAVIRGWEANHRILIGDDDQNLYEWSGAIPQEFFLPPLDDEHEMVLSQSYRVPRTVHTTAMAWLRGLGDRRQKKEYAPRPADGAVVRETLTLGMSEAGMPDGWFDPAGDETHMILTSAGYMLTPIIQYLREEGIPFHNPYRGSNKQWNPLDSSRERIRSYLKPSGIWSGNELLSWAKILQKKQAFHLGEAERLFEVAEQAGDEEMPYEALRHAFLPRVLNRVLNRDLSVIREMRLKASRGSWDYAFRVMDRPKKEREPRVVIGTIHSVKGGEADHVWLFPNLSRAALAEANDLRTSDRTVRLFYVAMTRARHTLHLCKEEWNGVVWPTM